MARSVIGICARWPASQVVAWLLARRTHQLADICRALLADHTRRTRPPGLQGARLGVSWTQDHRRMSAAVIVQTV